MSDLSAEASRFHCQTGRPSSPPLQSLSKSLAQPHTQPVHHLPGRLVSSLPCKTCRTCRWFSPCVNMRCKSSSVSVSLQILWTDHRRSISQTPNSPSTTHSAPRPARRVHRTHTKVDLVAHYDRIFDTASFQAPRSARTWPSTTPDYLDAHVRLHCLTDRAAVIRHTNRYCCHSLIDLPWRPARRGHSPGHFLLLPMLSSPLPWGSSGSA